MNKTPMELRNEKLGKTVCEALQKHGFDAYIAELSSVAQKKMPEKKLWSSSQTGVPSPGAAVLPWKNAGSWIPFGQADMP